MILAKVGPAFAQPAAGIGDIWPATLVVSLAVLTFVAALVAVRRYAERP